MSQPTLSHVRPHNGLNGCAPLSISNCPVENSPRADSSIVVSSVQTPRLECLPKPTTEHDPVALLHHDPQSSNGIGLCTKSSNVTEGTSDVGVTEACCPGAKGNGEHASTPKSARSIFIQFLQDFLCIKFQGFQSGFGKHPDLILFE